MSLVPVDHAHLWDRRPYPGEGYQDGICRGHTRPMTKTSTPYFRPFGRNSA